MKKTNLFSLVDLVAEVDQGEAKEGEEKVDGEAEVESLAQA